MAIAPVQRKGKAGLAVTSLAIGAGDGWATPTAGNLIVVTANSDATVATPAGYTAGPGILDGNAADLFWKIAAGTESTVTVTPGSAANTAMTACEYSGNTATPLDVSNSSTIAGSAGTTTTSVSVTTTAAGDLVIAVALIHSGIGGTAATGPTWTNSFVNVLTATNGNTTVTTDTFYAELTAGAAGPVSTSASWTNSANDRQELVIAFKAAAAAAVYPPYLQGRRRLVPPRYARPQPRAAKPVPPQLIPPYPSAGVKHLLRLRALLPRRGRAAMPTPPQLLPPYPPAGARHPGRLRSLLARRGRSAQVVPAQAVTAVAFVPQALRSRLRPYIARRRPAQFVPADQPSIVPPVRVHLRLPRPARGHATQPVPVQTSPTPPAYVPQGFRARVRSFRLFRARVAQPVPPQPAVPQPTLVPGRARQAAVRLVAARRAHAAVPPAAQAAPPLFTRVKLRAVRAFRGKPRPVVPPQAIVVPTTYPPSPVRSRKKPWPFRHRGAPQPPPCTCVTPRPGTGTTVRPSTGTTAYATATTARPSTGTTTRPDTGTTKDPCC